MKDMKDNNSTKTIEELLKDLVTLQKDFNTAKGDFAKEIASKFEQKDLNAVSQLLAVTIENTMMSMGWRQCELLSHILRRSLGLQQLMAGFSDWAERTADSLEDHEERLVGLELGTSSRILPEDAELLMKVIKGCEYLATALLNGPFPIYARDEEGQESLRELLALSVEAEQMVQGSVMDVEEEDEEEDVEADVAQPAVKEDKPS